MKIRSYGHMTLTRIGRPEYKCESISEMGVYAHYHYAKNTNEM